MLRNLKQPETSELFNGIDKYVELKTNLNAKYEFILGGDGRSRPWSEERVGKVITITIKEGVYLSYDQKDVVKSYAATLNPDHIIVKPK